MNIKANIYISLKSNVSDPQGATIAQGLNQLGFQDVGSVRAGKYIEVTLSAPSTEQAENIVKKMCADLLCNPIIEDYKFDLHIIN